MHDNFNEEVLARLDSITRGRVTEELSVLEEAGEPFDQSAVTAGDMTPVFFGSAMNNFGVQLLLDGFLSLSPPPRPQKTRTGIVEPADPRFSGFIFKIQSNMDPRHRDQIAFLRVCSGRFERDMKVLHARSGRTVRLASSHKLFGRDRETVNEAWPGDIIGIVGHSGFGIGDTLADDQSIVYRDFPRFTPEHFSYLHCANTVDFKKFRTGLDQLLREGVVQLFSTGDSQQKLPLLGAVGPLQFEVLQHRLQSEYGAGARLEASPWTVVRWVTAGADELESAVLPSGSRRGSDSSGNPVLFFPKEWECSYFMKNHPKINLSRLPPEDAAG